MKNDRLYRQFDSVFFEKTRLSIITILYKEGVASFNRIKTLIGGSDGAVFSHLGKLQESGYLVQKKEIAGNRAQTTYTLTKTGKKEFTRYLQFMSDLLETQKEASEVRDDE